MAARADAQAADRGSATPARLHPPCLRLSLDAIDHGAGPLLPDGTRVYADAGLRARLPACRSGAAPRPALAVA